VIVLDSSAAIDYLLAYEPNASWVEEHLRVDPDLHVPHLFDIEIVGAVRRKVLFGDLSQARGKQAVLDVVDLDVTRYPHTPFLARIWELRRNLTAYDAPYVALAEALGVPLVTTDRSLAGAPGPRVPIVFPA
jgi:predicted nucleic acid-binding protein